MRLVRISLAAKYRILFGLAVLLIIGAALYVPWRRMKTLVSQQSFGEAQRVAEDYFRLVMAEPNTSAGASGGGLHGQGLSLLGGESAQHEVAFVRIDRQLDDPDSVWNQADTSPFIAEAVKTFVRNPKSREYYSPEPRARRFEYAHAVRVEKRCLDCHDEGKPHPYRENQLAGIITVSLPTLLSEREVVFNRLVILAAGALAGILAILVFYVITQKFILSPIHELREVAIRVGDGDLTVRSTVQTGDEFEQLSENVNTMLERLRASREELSEANRRLDQKLDEMAERNVALYESNRLKSEFLTNVSHELRTPLTSIIGFAELLREGPQSEDDGKAARYAENILISGRILLEIINDLLDLAKIEAGKIEFRIESVHLDEFCASLLDFTRPLADNKQLTVGMEADEALPVVFTDPSLLRQILFNLLSNAVKFTPEEGTVRLAIRRAGDTNVRISVTDTGPGIAPEDHEAIFEKFRQIDQSKTREFRGTGLGLAIAKELTYLLGGEIGVDSQAGFGATFWIRLPTTAPEPGDRPLISLV